MYQLNVELDETDWHTLKGLLDITRAAVPDMTMNDFASGVLSNGLEAYRSKMPAIVGYGKNLQSEVGSEAPAI